MYIQEAYTPRPHKRRESDAMTIVNAILDEKESLTTNGHLLDEIKTLVLTIHSVSLLS